MPEQAFGLAEVGKGTSHSGWGSQVGDGGGGDSLCRCRCSRVSGRRLSVIVSGSESGGVRAVMLVPLREEGDSLCVIAAAALLDL